MMKFLCFLWLPFLGFSQGSLEAVDVLFQEKQYQQAEVFLNQYLQNHPNALQAKVLLGDAYAYQKQWDKAMVIYKDAIKIDQKNAEFHYKYGAILSMKALENKLMAIAYISDIKASFIKASQLDNTHINTRWALVKVYMELPGIFGGSQEKALKYAQELEAISKVDGYLAKGYIYEYNNQFKQAEHYYKKAVHVGGSLTCYKKLITLYENENKPQKAIETIALAQQKYPEYKRDSLH